MIRFKSLHEMTPLEVHQLYKLRVDVFVAEQNCPFNEIDDQDALPETRHILAFDGEQLAGCARVFPTEAQAGLVGYYSQFGFVAEGEEFLDTGVPNAPCV